MTRRIHRKALFITDEVIVTLPVDVRFLYVAPSREFSNMQIDLWYEITFIHDWATDEPIPDKRTAEYTVWIHGTGHLFEHDGQYVGTTVHPNGLVFHTYVGAPEEPQ